PQVVYVPTYNPTVAYGAWPYPAYPPVYYPPPAAYYPVGTALVSGMAFATGVAVVGSLSGWSNCNWGHGDVNINTNRYNTINSANIRSGRATAASSNTWRHDASHRGGVAYRDGASRQAYQGGARPAAATRDFRGYSGTQRGAAAGQRTAGQGTSRPAGATANRVPGQAGASPGARQPSAGARASATGASATSRQPAAFQGVGNGSQVRAQSARQQAERHIISLEPTMTRQESVIARMQYCGDGAGVAEGRELLVTIRHCLALAVAHRNGLLRAS